MTSWLGTGILLTFFYNVYTSLQITVWFCAQDINISAVCISYVTWRSRQKKILNSKNSCEWYGSRKIIIKILSYRHFKWKLTSTMPRIVERAMIAYGVQHPTKTLTINTTYIIKTNANYSLLRTNCTYLLDDLNFLS